MATNDATESKLSNISNSQLTSSEVSVPAGENSSPSNLDRRSFLKQGLVTSGLLLGGTALSGQQQAIAGSNKSATTSTQPNILVILTDQERGWFWYPSTFPFATYLPYRQWLKSQGISFTNYYVPSNPCSPSRSTLFTGQHTDITQVFDNVNTGYQPSLSASIATVGHMIAESTANYYAAYLGKWHLTTEEDLDNYPTTYGRLDPYGFHDWQGHDYEGIDGNEGLQYDSEIADNTIHWIDEHRSDSRPWLLVSSLLNPHDIANFPTVTANAPSYGLSLSANHRDPLTSKPTAQRYWQQFYNDYQGNIDPTDDAQWLQMLNDYAYYQIQVDIQIGRILSALGNTLLKKTVIIFTSDHGELAGSHMLRAKGPTVYRESQNVPFVIVDPRTSSSQRGISTQALASAIDLTPTILSIAGADPSAFGLKGKNLMNVVNLDSPSSAATTAVRDGVLFTYDALQGSPSPSWSGHIRGIFDGTYKFARYYSADNPDASLEEQELELYDINGMNGDGNAELTNRAYDAAYADVVTSMNDKLSQLLASEIGS